MQLVVRAAAAALAILLSLAPFGSARAADPLEMYALIPLTGPLAFYGAGIATSLGALEKTANASGGINGRNVHINILDDQANPQIAVQLLGPILSKGAPVVIDAGPAATCKATAALAKTASVIFCLSTAYEPVADPYSFTTPMSLEDALAAQIRFFRVRGLKRLGFIIANDATGQASDAVLTNIMNYPENRGMSVVVRERFGLADISLTAQVAHLRSANVQAVYALASGAPFGLILREMRDAGLNVPTSTLASNQSAKQMESYGTSVPPDLEMTSARWAAYSRMQGGPVKDKVAQFRSAMARAGLAGDYGPASLPWDPGMFIIAAYRKYGESMTPANLKDYISNIRNVPGICGFYDFVTTPGRGLNAKDTVVLRWDAGRKDFIPISTAGGTAVLH
jgi:branched-chain amino acid transport system substrate-binding protein